MIYLTFYFSNFSPSRPTAALFSFACKKPRKFFQRLAPLFFRLRPSDALAFSSAPVRASRSKARPSPLFWLSVSPENGVCNPFSLSSRNIFSCSRGPCSAGRDGSVAAPPCGGSTGHGSLFSHGCIKVWGAPLSGGCQRPPSRRRAGETPSQAKRTGGEHPLRRSLSQFCRFPNRSWAQTDRQAPRLAVPMGLPTPHHRGFSG